MTKAASKITLHVLQPTTRARSNSTMPAIRRDGAPQFTTLDVTANAPRPTKRVASDHTPAIDIISPIPKHKTRVPINRTMASETILSMLKSTTRSPDYHRTVEQVADPVIEAPTSAPEEFTGAVGHQISSA